MLLDDALGDGEAEAEAAVRGAVRAGEALEDVLLLILGDAEPVIGDGEMDAVAGQMTLGLLLDHFGFVGVPLHTTTPLRFLGAAMVVAGVLLLRLT